MHKPVLLIAAGLALTALATPADAQSWTRRDVWEQRDVPGDWRCDSYWDANRDNCGAAWRDQRHRATRQWSSHGYDQGYGYAGDWRRRGYGQGRRYESGNAYYGAYGRPDLVYPEGGRSYGSGYGGGARDPRRIDWCRANYRSYDPHSGYYRAYSGRLVWCG